MTPRSTAGEPTPTIIGSDRQAWGILWALCAVEFANFVGNGIIAPILPLYAQSFKVSTTLIGFLVSIFGLARLVVDLPTGYLAERVGRRLLLITGPLIVVVGSVLSGVAGSFPELLLYRFLSGIGSAIFTTVGTVVVADISTPANRGRFMSYFQSALLLGVSFGPAIGGFVARFWGLQATFFVSAAFTLLSALWALWRMPETRTFALGGAHDGSDDQQPPRLRDLLSLLKSGPFLLISAVLFGIFASRTGSQQTILPLAGFHQVQLSTVELGLAFTLMSLVYLVTLPLSGYLADRFGRKVTIVPGVALTGLCFALFGVIRLPWLFFAGSALLGFSGSLGGPGPNAYAADVAPPGRQGLTMGLFRTFGDLGFVVGPVLLGWLADVRGYQAALWSNAAFLLALALLFWLLAPETVGRQAGRRKVEAAEVRG